MKTLDTTNFDEIVLKLASPERIREWSFGEVTKPETINYRTGSQNEEVSSTNESLDLKRTTNVTVVSTSVFDMQRYRL
jgi:hypothetical protein